MIHHTENFGGYYRASLHFPVLIRQQQGGVWGAAKPQR